MYRSNQSLPIDYFSDFEVEENEEDSHLHNEESEIRISREELLARYQVSISKYS